MKFNLKFQISIYNMLQNIPCECGFQKVKIIVLKS